ncbi:hypothetical protein HBE96_22005 [Clostridium sp. P21]|uniref:Uncharacterized protein n=1 Tax=Clostridium muellerianum TaxID=2716538 RepID=A0A7Y0EKR4_9CLOT|nr:hypothetical protein [Clostridium muellerianum]NMM65261.1 hypothetical protein [Clostridium muellerianum]
MIYKFKPYIWQVGGKFVYSIDNDDNRQYNCPCGFNNFFKVDKNLPFNVILCYNCIKFDIARRTYYEKKC